MLEKNRKAERKFNDFSDMIKEEADRLVKGQANRFRGSGKLVIEINQLKKDNSKQLTKLWSDYNKSTAIVSEFILNNFGYAIGGVVDMRNGGKVGAAVVAASLMASGGQAMDMRNGGVVGMKKGGWLEKATDYTGKVAEQMDSLLEKKYEKHLSDVAEAKQNAKKIGRNVTEPVPIPTMDVSKTTDVPIPTMDTTDVTTIVPSRKHIYGKTQKLVEKHLKRFTISDREQALNNLDSWTEFVRQSESDGNWKAKELRGETTASGGFQFVKPSVEPALNRLEKYMGKMPWRNKLLKHKDASRLSPEQQTLLFLGDILDKKIDKTTGVGDAYIKRILSGDERGMIEAYYKMQHTNKGKLTEQNKERIRSIFTSKSK